MISFGISEYDDIPNEDIFFELLFSFHGKCMFIFLFLAFLQVIFATKPYMISFVGGRFLPAKSRVENQCKASNLFQNYHVYTPENLENTKYQINSKFIEENKIPMVIMSWLSETNPPLS